MIKFTRLETRNIDEKALFKDLKDYLFEQEIFFNGSNDIVDIIDLPKEVQRLIFSRIGAMMIDYAESEDFLK